LTEREAQILKIIKKNPMISQNEIADILQITRSSVSVHITSLLKSGAIKGRGYVVSEPDYPIAIGAATVHLKSAFQQTESSENGIHLQDGCEINLTFEGSARNISENLVRLGEKPLMISAIANDLFGNEILRICQQHGISTEHCLLLNNEKSTIYLEIINPKGLNITGLANNTAEQNLTPDFLETKYNTLKNAKQIVMDDELPQKSIEYITSNFNSSDLFLLTTRNLSRISNYRRYMERFNGLIFSFRTACELCGIPLIDSSQITHISDDQILEMSRKLCNCNVKDQIVIFPVPQNKLCYCCKDGTYLLEMPGSGDALNSFKTTRDAMMSGLMYASSYGFSIEKSILFIAACHETSSEVNLPVNTFMCSDLVNRFADEIKKRSDLRKLI
jgi:pseudouridine kinase